MAAAASAAIAAGVLTDSGFIAVHGDLANIDSVAGSITNVNAVAAALSTLASIAADLTTLNSIAADLSNINVVAGDHTAIVTVAADKTNIDAVAADVTNINLVAGSITPVNNVAADLTALNAIAAALTALNAVYADLANINTVAGDTANINTVAGDTANINAVAGDLTNLNAIAAALTALNSIYSDLTNINAVAAALTAINAAAANAATATTQAGIATTEAGLAAASAVTAASQASLSAGYAASAGSAIQQDISGVTAAALHRSPNAVVAMMVYDTTKDSDGGAWTERCQHTSWYNESLNGKWLGACASESAARAVSGATTGDYFQLTTDGKFYKLNATSGTTEVFRGNKAKAPKLIGIAAEAGNVNLYDLTEKGFPMWMRFVNGSTKYIYGATVSSIACLNGVLAVGTTGSPAGYSEVNFAKDSGQLRGTGGLVTVVGGISSRNGTAVFGVTVSSGALVNGTVNTVAMTVLPDAPVDPVSGLQMPTIAVGTAGGVSVIKHDGSVVNSSSTSSFTALTLSKDILTAGRADVNFYYALNPGSLGSSFVLVTDASLFLAPWLTTTALVQTKKSEFLRLPNLSYGIGGWVQKVRTKDSSFSNGAIAVVTENSNSGYMLGDIRRCYMADSGVETVTPTDLHTGDSSNFSGGIGSWVNVGITSLTWDSTNKYLVLTNTSGAYAGNAQLPLASLGLTIGKTYVAIVTFAAMTGAAGNWGTIYLAQSGADTSLYSSYGGIPPYGNVAKTYYCPFIYRGGSAPALRIYVGNTTATVSVSSVLIRPAVIDRSRKNGVALITGSLTKALSSPSASNQLVAYSGFSASNYLQEPYSADLDFGTGEWNVSAWVNIPVSQSAAGFPYLTGTQLVTNGTFAGVADNSAPSVVSAQWSMYNSPTSAQIVGEQLVIVSAGANQGAKISLTAGAGKWFEFSYTYSGTGAAQVPMDGTAAPGLLGVNGSGTVTGYIYAASSSILAYCQTNSNAAGTSSWDNFSFKEIDYRPTIVDRSYSSGAYIRLGITGPGYLVATAYDGTTTRTVTTSASYSTGTNIKAEAIYRADGSLAILVNGIQVAVTYGNPLLTLNNSNAVTTIGNNYALSQPFPGKIALLKLSATAPTPDQSLWMYEQEKHLFRDGAQSLLPDSGNIVDLTYDEVTDKWIAVSATNESDWTGLVRTNVTAVPAGSNIKASAGSGIKLNARSTTSPGVDVTIPAWNLREELVKRAEAKQKDQPTVIFDFSGGFTATTVNGNTAITSVASLTYPAQGTLRGATVTGTGIPASTTIVDISGTTIYLSKACTASASSVQVSFLDFILPVGYEARAVLSAGALKQEGSTKDWTRSFDSFREKVTFGTSPGYSAFVELQAIRSIA